MTIWRNIGLSNSNGLRLVMTFPYSRYNPNQASPEEMLEISQEINREFAPAFFHQEAGTCISTQAFAEELFEISEEIRIELRAQGIRQHAGIGTLASRP